MTHRAAPTQVQREQRKQSLLLASRLARGQAVIALGELGGRADAVADGMARVRERVSSPLVWALGSAVGAFLLTVKRDRTRGVGLLSWIWPAWRVWRSVATVLAAYRAGAGSKRNYRS